MDAPLEKPVRRTAWQFSLRGIFAATLAVAIVSAVAAPKLRAAEPKQREAFYWIAFEVVLGALLCTALMCWIQSRMEKSYGALLLLLPKRIRPIHWIVAITQFVMPFWLILSSVSLVFGTNDPPWLVRFNPAALMSGWLLSQAFFMWWRGFLGPIQICERGICSTYLYAPWNECKEYRLGADGVVHLRKKLGTVQFDVPRERLGEVDATLRRFVARSPAISAPAASSEKESG